MKKSDLLGHKIPETVREQSCQPQGCGTTNQTNNTISNRWLIEEIIHLENLGLGACQGCGMRLLEGQCARIYAFQASESGMWQAGQARCSDCPLALDALATLGVCEVVVEGRVARCVDQANQSSWRVLLDPETRSISPSHVTAAFDAPVVPEPRCCAAGCVERSRPQAACVAGMRGRF